MSDFQNDLRNYVESSANPVTAEEVMGSDLVTRRVDPSTRRGLVVALAAAALVLAAVVGASFFINRTPDQIVPAGTTATTQAGDPASDSTVTTTVSSTTLPDTPTSTVPGVEPVLVSGLFDGEVPRNALVTGFVVWNASGARLCDFLNESLPPLCEGAWLVIADPDLLDLQLEQSQGVRWTSGLVEIQAWYDGNRLVIGGEEAALPTPEDLALVEAFAGFATTPDQETAARVPFSDEVVLGLASNAVATLPQDGLADPNNWSLAMEVFRARTGPFSALTLVERPFIVTLGTHPHCASPPVGPPAGFDTYQRISLQPETTTSCLEWWTVDLFVDADGNIGAVTMDLYEP